MFADFENGDYPALTLTRASVGTYVDEDRLIQTALANAPRFDWRTGRRALLVEPAATNLSIYSQMIDSWGAVNVAVTPNVAVAPSGLMTADRVVENMVNDQHRVVRSNVSIVSGNVYEAKIFGKSANREVRLTLFAGSGEWSAAAYFNLMDGTIGVVSGATALDAMISPFPDGYYEMRLRASAVGTTAVAQFLVGLAIGGNVIYAGDGVSGADLWGAQIEAVAASSYIKTDAAPVTRAADAPSLTLAAGTYDVRVTTSAGTTDALAVVHGGGAFWPAAAVGRVYSIEIYEAGGL